MADSITHPIRAYPQKRERDIFPVTKPFTRNDEKGINGLRKSMSNRSLNSDRSTATGSQPSRTSYRNYNGYGYSPRMESEFGSPSKDEEATSLPFMMEDLYCDTILVVEDKKFYIHRSLLGYASNYFAKLFMTAHSNTSNSEKKTKPEVILKDKSYSDILELLAFFHPGVCKDLTAKTALRLLPIAEEYQMLSLKHRCEIVLLSHLKKNSDSFHTNPKGPPTQRYRRDNTPDILLRCTKAADKGNSKILLDQCLKIFSNPEISLKDVKLSADISDQTKARIFETRIDTTSTKLSRVYGELEKEKLENNLLKKKLSDRSVYKSGLRTSVVDNEDNTTVMPNPSGPDNHAHHYNAHQRQNKGKEQNNPPSSPKRNNGYFYV